MAKKNAKRTNKKATKKPRRKARGEDTAQRKKYDRGGRIEAYTMGEALGKKKHPTWG